MNDTRKQLIILIYLGEYLQKYLFNNMLNENELKYLYNILTLSSTKNIIEDLNISEQTYKHHRHNLYNKIKNDKNFNKNIEPKNTILYNCIYSAIKTLIPLDVFHKLNIKYDSKLRHFDKKSENGIDILPTGFKL